MHHGVYLCYTGPSQVERFLLSNKLIRQYMTSNTVYGTETILIKSSRSQDREGTEVRMLKWMKWKQNVKIRLKK